MKRSVALSVLGLCLAASAFANPTGAPLQVFPVHPCRIFDTRVSLGPLPDGYAVDVFVRGDNLPASYGALQSDCGVPREAEAVIVNVTAINPSAAGYLKISGTGWVTSPAGAYARLTFNAGDLVSNEMTISLCNIYLYPADHAACFYDSNGHYADFQIVSAGASVHIAAEVVAYLKRPD